MTIIVQGQLYARACKSSESQGGVLTLTGLAEDTEVVVYTANGVQVGAATAANGTASIATGMEAGAIAIVKIGEHSIKVAIK